MLKTAPKMCFIKEIITTIYFLGLSPIIAQIIFGKGNSFISIWDIETGFSVPNSTWKAHQDSVNCLKLLKNGNLVSGSTDEKLFVWNIRVFPPIKIAEFNEHRNDVYCVEQLNNSNVVSSGADRDLFIWNPNNGQVINSKENAHQKSILCLKLLSNGFFASGSSDSKISIWNPNSMNTDVFSLAGHSSDVIALELLANGNLVSVSLDGFSIVWDVFKITQVNKFKPLNGDKVRCVKELPNGTIAYGGDDPSVYFWRINGLGAQSFESVSTNILGNDSPCQTMLLYRNSLLAVVSSGLVSKLLDVRSSGNFSVVKNLSASNSFVKCVESIPSSSNTISTSTTTVLTTTINPTTTQLRSTTSFFTTSSSLTIAPTNFYISNTQNGPLNMIDNDTQIINYTTTTRDLTTSRIEIKSTSLSQSSEAMTEIKNISILASLLLGFEFILDELPIDIYVNLLNSSYDLSDCIVNCSNNGVCKYAGQKIFTCDCQNDYAGKTCQTSLLPCSYGPCLNNATCINNQTLSSSYSYTCVCQENYFGKHCEYKLKVCGNETCSGNGYCKDVNETAYCECFYSYRGDRCETETDERKVRKVVVSTATLVAISFIGVSMTLVLLSDVMSFNKTNKKIKKKQSGPAKRFKYVP